jgi:hypothetical protein
LSAEDAAEGRTRRLLERERKMRVGDGFRDVCVDVKWAGGGGKEPVEERDGWEDEMDGDGSEEESGCNTEETTEKSFSEVDSPETAKECSRVTIYQNLQRTTDDTHVFGIENNFRREVIEWILYVGTTFSFLYDSAC